MMLAFSWTTALLLCSSLSSTSSSTTSFTRGLVGVTPYGSLFAVPRGGGLFGGKDDSNKENTMYVYGSGRVPYVSIEIR
jgi:hypothetical protein